MADIINSDSISCINQDIIQALDHVRCALGHLCKALDVLECSIKIKSDLDDTLIKNRDVFFQGKQK